MFAALFTLLATLAFAAGPFLVPNFAGFAPDRFPVPQVNPPVTPAGWAFAIWGPIYLWLVISAVFGVVFRRDAQDWAAMRPALIASLAVGAAWLPVAQQSPRLAAVMIWVMLVAALAALFRTPTGDRFMASWPIGLYAGWLSAASCVALGLNLAGNGLMSSDLAAQLMIALATVIAAAIQIYLRRAPTYGAAIAIAAITVFAAYREMRRRPEATT